MAEAPKFTDQDYARSEAWRRGLLPAEQAGAVGEAIRRGLLPDPGPAKGEDPSVPQRLPSYGEAAQPKPLAPPNPETAGPVGMVSDAATMSVNDAARRIKSMWGATKRMATGEGVELEYPDAPEVTAIDSIGFWESLVPNLKTGMTLDPVEKAKIIKGSFQGDPRLGQVFQDAKGHPMLEWEGTKYYINKPGFTRQDAGDAVAQTAQFLGPSKFAIAGRGMLGRALRGYPAYTGTDLAQQSGTMLSGGRENLDLPKAAGTGGIGVGVDAVLGSAAIPLKKFILPHLANLARRGGQGAAQTATGAAHGAAAAATGGRVQLPRYIPPQPTSARFPQTRGQRSGSQRQLEEEDIIRHSAQYGGQSTDIIKGFDERQMATIADEAGQMQRGMGEGTGLTPGDDTVAGELLAERIKSTAASLKAEGSNAFTAVRDAPDIFLGRMDLGNIAAKMGTVADEMGIGRHQMSGMPILNRNHKFVQRLSELTQNERFKAQSFNSLVDFRKQLNVDIGTAAKGSPEQLALTKMRRIMDTGIDDAVTNSLFQGDPGAVHLLRKANDLWRSYKQIAGDRGGDAVDKLLNATVHGDKSAAQTLSAIMGATVLDKGVGINFVKRLKSSLGADSEAIRLLKDAVIYRTFVGGVDGGKRVTRAAITKNFEKNFKSKGGQFTRELFSPEEIAQIQKFADDVLPTMPAETRFNPSGTSYTILGKLRENGLLGTAFSVAQRLPGAEAVSQGMGAGRARAAISQVEEAFFQPLFGAATIGSAGSSRQ